MHKKGMENPEIDTLIEPSHDKTSNLGFLPGLTQTGLYCHRRKPEA